MPAGLLRLAGRVWVATGRCMSQRMLQLIQPPLGKQVLLDVLKLLEVCAHSCNPMRFCVCLLSRVSIHCEN
jgi:hypothetical protein